MCKTCPHCGGELTTVKKPKDDQRQLDDGRWVTLRPDGREVITSFRPSEKGFNKAIGAANARIAAMLRTPMNGRTPYKAD